MAGFISWTPQQVSKLREAINNYNKHVRVMQDSGVFDISPKETSLRVEKQRIQTRQELQQRIKELNRINLSDAYEGIELENGKIMPNYMYKEIQYIINSENEERAQRRLELNPGWSNLTNVEQAAKLAGKNLSELNALNYTTPEDFEYLLSLKYTSDQDYIDLYLDVWEELNGDSEITNIIERIQQENPSAFREIMDGDYDETKINYIYPDKASSATGRYKGGTSPDMTPSIVREQNIEKFWQWAEAHYLEGDDRSYSEWLAG